MVDEAAWQACAAIVERGDEARFAAAMSAPVQARPVLFPLYAFNVEVSRAPWVTQEPMIAEMRLQWWRDAMDEIAEDREVRRHEVTTPLGHLLAPRQAELLGESVAARRWDIYRDPFEDDAHFEAYFDQTAGHLMWISAQLLADVPKDAEVSVRRLARAAGLAAYFRAIPELEARSRVPLLDGRAEAIEALARGALADIQSFKIAQVPKAARSALLPAAVARGVLKQVAQEPERVSQDRLELTPFARSMALLKASFGVY